MKQIIQTKNAPAPVGPYNQAVVANGILYVSGQIAINPETGELESGGIKSETERVMQNLAGVLAEANTTFENVIKCTIFMTDMGNYAAINEVYSRYFNDDTAPAREAVEVSNLPKYVNVEISCIATV
ncbi:MULTISPECIES: Rid family detoxifying hydrolase [unclassified Aureispira]|uniref:Rid family detoxifying hydrolase n=1 Tax=unclassified Aureispira TaxID=2649989 RepID=UPI000698ACCB|nr:MULTISPECIES: Rid family detoxifying hydrolase [unclassified Aureispira]WMX14029.1 Rid family detoxifying hydrolase [Aureispira sp. CCB-E]